MSMQVPALHAPLIPDQVEIDAAAEAAERRREVVEAVTTVFVTTVVVTLISILGVALELG